MDSTNLRNQCADFGHSNFGVPKFIHQNINKIIKRRCPVTLVLMFNEKRVRQKVNLCQKEYPGDYAATYYFSHSHNVSKISFPVVLI